MAIVSIRIITRNTILEIVISICQMTWFHIIFFSIDLRQAEFLLVFKK